VERFEQRRSEARLRRTSGALAQPGAPPDGAKSAPPVNLIVSRHRKVPLRRFALASFCVLAVVGVAVWSIGSVLVAASPGSVPNAALAIPHEAVAFQSKSGSTLRGWLVPGEPERGSVVLMHGIRASRLSMVGRARFLWNAGYTVLLFDFQAHGESPGSVTTFGHLEARDARAAVDLLRRRSSGGPILAIGVSLGGVAAVLGEEPLQVEALVLEAVYPSIAAAAANRLNIRLGFLGRLLAPLLLLQLEPRLHIKEADLAPVEGIRRVTAPLLIVAGAIDRHTTLEDSKRLFAAAPDPKELWVIPGAAHVDFHAYVGSGYESKVLGFFRKYAKRQRGGG
jgi:fermentation-respiration switch protein FrsA (DUF1100 family)